MTVEELIKLLEDEFPRDAKVAVISYDEYDDDVFIEYREKANRVVIF